MPVPQVGKQSQFFGLDYQGRSRNTAYRQFMETIMDLDSRLTIDATATPEEIAVRIDDRRPGSLIPGLGERDSGVLSKSAAQ